MSTMAVRISGRPKLSGLVHFAVSRLVTLGKEPGANEFTVAAGSGEVVGCNALAFPFAGHRAEISVVEALSFGPDAGVNDADDKVRAEVGFFQEEAGAVRGGF